MTTSTQTRAINAVEVEAQTPEKSGDKGPRRYLHGVQGLRTVAALMVAVYHIWFHRVSGGVDVFFVVAGFFAAGSILKVTARRGTRERLRALGKYWLRTARRVVPSAVVVVIGTVVASFLFLPRSHWTSTIPDGWASLGFWQNWNLMDNGNDYLLDGIAASPFQQFWALAIQVQSYLLYPLIALLAAALTLFVRGSQRRTLPLVVGACFALSLTWSIVMTAGDQPAAYFHLGPRMWEFLAGTLLALLLRRPLRSRALAKLLGWSGLLTILAFAAVVDPSELLPGLLALVPVLGAVAIIIASHAGAEPRLLRIRPLIWFADSSFAFYLWHWPILVLYRWQFRETVSLKAGLAILVLSAALAVVTTYLVEKPIREWPLLGRSAAASVLACLLLLAPAAGALKLWDAQNSTQTRADWESVATVLEGGSLLPGEFAPSTAIARQDLSVAYERGCQQYGKPAEVITCVWGDEDADTTIAIVGASHETQWIDLVAETADELGVRLITMTKGACPFGAMAGSDRPVNDSCLEWLGSVMAHLMSEPPDLVFTIATRRTAGVEVVPEWKVAYLQQLSDAGIPVLGIRDNPWFGRDVPGCIDVSGVEACGVARADALTPLADLNVPDLPHFTFVDTADDFCDELMCPAVRNGVLVSWDGTHLTRTWTMTNGDTVRDAIIRFFDTAHE